MHPLKSNGFVSYDETGGHRTDPLPGTLTAAVVGTGRGAEHLRWLADCPGVTPLTVPGDEASDRIREGGLDVVVVASPTHTHQDLVAEALRQDLAVVCETPLAPGVPAALALTTLAAERGAQARVPFQWRTNNALGQARSALLHGEIGDLLTVDIALHDDSHLGPGTRWPWRERRETAGGGAMAELGTHALDLLSWSTGLGTWDVESAWAQRLYDSRRGPQGQVEVDVDDIAQAELRPLGSAARARVHVSRISPEGRQLYFTAVGSRGTLRVVAEAKNGSATLVLTTGARSLRATVGPHSMNPYRAPASAGADPALTDGAGLGTFDEALAAVHLVEAAQRRSVQRDPEVPWR